jgi:hypothetical protein
VTGAVTVASLATIPDRCFIGIDWTDEVTLKEFYDADTDEKTEDAPVEMAATGESSGVITLDECIELYYHAEKLSEHNMWYAWTLHHGLLLTRQVLP